MKNDFGYHAKKLQENPDENLFRRGAASRCHNNPALEKTPVLPPVTGRKVYSPIAVITQSIGYQLYRSECAEEETQMFPRLYAICTLTRTKCASRVNIVSLFEVSVQTWPKNDCAHNQHAAGSHDAVA